MAHQELGMELLKRVEADLPNTVRSNSILRWKDAS
jgi:hypothetical protein